MKNFLHRWSPWHLRRQVKTLRTANNAIAKDFFRAAEINNDEVRLLRSTNSSLARDLTEAREEIKQFNDKLDRVTEQVKTIVNFRGKQITRAQAEARLPTEAECEVTRAEFRRKPPTPEQLTKLIEDQAAKLRKPI